MPSEETNKVAYEARAQNTLRARKKYSPLLSEEIKGARREQMTLKKEKHDEEGMTLKRLKEYSDTCLNQRKKKRKDRYSADVAKEKAARKECYTADVAKEKAARIELMQLKKKLHVKSATQFIKSGT